MLRHLASSSILALLGPLSPSFADEIRVPADQPDLADAVAVAQAGDVILVQTASPQGNGSTVVVDKPLTIRGDPICFISLNSSALRLSGPGSGRVTLENVRISYEIGDAQSSPALRGDGFEEVVLVGCEILQDLVAATGLLTEVRPAIDVTVDRLTLLDCDVLGGPAGTDECFPGILFSYEDGREGILAPGADILLLNTTINGGRGGTVSVTDEPCPPNFADWPGKGGIGVVAKSVAGVHSTVAGGVGATWLSVLPGLCNTGTGVPCGTHPQAAAFDLNGAAQQVDAGLATDSASISLSDGGQQRLFLVGEPALGGSIYLLLGSFGGSSPGLPLGGLELPLVVPDPYFTYSYNNPNGPVLGASLGLLDFQGRATATVTLPPGLMPMLAGTTATHAYAVADSTLGVVAVSNPTTLELLP